MAKEDKNKAGKTTSQDVSAADRAAANAVPKGTKTGAKVGVTGLPVGTPINVGQREVRDEGRYRGTTSATAKTQYAVGDGMSTLLGMDNPQRVQLLSVLSQIPGLYPKGRAYTAEQLQSVAAGEFVAIREEDADALEKVMQFADTVGVTYDVAAQRLFNQPNIAASFYGYTPPKGPKLLPEKSLIAEISDKFQNTFDANVPKDVAKKYAAEVRSAQAKGGGLSAQEREDILLKYLEREAGNLSKQEGFQPRGVLGEYIQQLRQEYYENGLPMDENRIYKMAVKSLRDPQELQNNKQKIQQRAELVFPPLREYLARGESVRDVLSPYMRIKASIFEMNDTDINPSDMYDVMDGDKLKNINDYKKSLYQSPEYKKTQGYKQRVVSDTRGLLDYLGID